MDALTLVFVVLALAVGGALGYLLAGRKDSAEKTAMAMRIGTAEGKVAELTALAERQAEDEAGYRSLQRMVGPLETRLIELHRQVTTTERDQAAAAAELREQLKAHALTGAELSRSTSMLAGALRNASSRGMWGEVELERLVEAAGMQRHTDFTTQTGLAGGARPDMIIHLPAGAAIALDAKVPFDAYLLATELAEDPSAEAAARRTELLKEHAKSMKRHIDALAARNYPEALNGGIDLTVMFVPAEPLLAAACTTDPTLLEYALRKRISLATPVSLLAILRNIAATWSREEVSERASQLLEASQEMVRRLATFAQHLDGVGKSLDGSIKAYNKAVGSFDSRLTVHARALADLGVADVPQVRQVEVAPRTVSYQDED
ncbi:DNA recombination protein RmuC [Bowdeniella nasicola]|uniref:DNA recombination protein RmuC n=1 Tax=Bowdeniella nasicola TaxID=208480 RepID=A0A1H4A337_9ACTO|nr:DNA recombination protein RmuC [Bowdeniella nasicola]SEA30208.1 DNA recombination protein RmuC [Bowdeniella nasicola]